MLSRLRTHLRHNVVGYLALFFALSGSAVAANAALKVGDSATGDLSGTYPGPSIADGAVTGGSAGKVADNSLTGDDIASGAVGITEFSNKIPAASVWGGGQIVTVPDVNQSGFITLNWPAENYDTGNPELHSTSNPSRLTAPVAGIYRISTQVRWGPNSSGARALSLLRNGFQAVVNDAAQHGEGAFFASQQHSAEARLAAGDYIEVQAYQNSGGDAELIRDSFTMSWVAPG